MITSNMFNFIFVPILLLFLVVKSVISQHSQCKNATGCESDLKESDCANGESLQYDPNVMFGCCPVCRPGTPAPDACRPPASCLPDGSHASVQCKGDWFTGRYDYGLQLLYFEPTSDFQKRMSEMNCNGTVCAVYNADLNALHRCFCSDRSGNRIFGQMWRREAKKMSCACSKRRAELEASESRVVSLHCTPTGDYELLQCDNGLCWCAQPRTGQPTVQPVLQKNLKLLPCYNAASMGESYLRRCESVVQALAEIHKEQSAHGTKYLSKSATLCDYDGSYGAYKIQGTSAYCTGRDGTILGAWLVEANKVAGMNCNCARDTSVYFPAVGMTVAETCESNGNYKTQQNIGDYSYCVDSDGYPIDCPAA